MTPTPKSAEEIAQRIYLDLEGYLDSLVDDIDKKLIQKDIAESLTAYADSRLEEAAQILDRNISKPNTFLASDIRSLKSPPEGEKK